jgi:hypothetical protein
MSIGLRFDVDFRYVFGLGFEVVLGTILELCFEADFKTLLTPILNDFWKGRARPPNVPVDMSPLQ